MGDRSFVGRACRSLLAFRGGCTCTGGRDQVEREIGAVVIAVSDQLDAAVYLRDGVFVVTGEVAGHAWETRTGPVDLVGNLIAEHFHDQQLELGTMVY